MQQVTNKAKSMQAYGNCVSRAAKDVLGIDIERSSAPVLHQVVPVRIIGRSDDIENPNHGFTSKLLPGHYLGDAFDRKYGPNPNNKCRIMIIGRAPTASDDGSSRLFSSKANDWWLNIIQDSGVDLSEVYVTNLVRFVPPNGIDKIKAGWITECLRLLHDEIEMVKPDLIIAMGRDVVSALLGRGVTLSSVRGSTTLKFNNSKLVCTTHPYALTIDPSQIDGFESDLRMAVRLATTDELKVQETDYQYLYTKEALQSVVDACLEEAPEWLSVDCEWGGETKSDYLHGKLRFVQFSWKPKTGYAVVLRSEGLVTSFVDGEDAAVVELKRLFSEGKFKICGHAFRADQKFLEALGVSTKAWECGFDTMLGYHLLKPYADGYGLEELAIRYTDMGRYDIPVAKWLKDNKFNKTKLEVRGYADVPDDILLPYAVADVDVVIRLVPVIIQRLKDSRLSQPYRLNNTSIETLYDVYRCFVHPATMAINEIEKEGVYVDYDRLLALINLFQEKKEELYNRFTEMIGWPEFNFRAVDQVRELLFGTQPKRGRLRPESALTLGITPLKTTDKPSKNWDTVPQYQIQAGTVSPSTDGETLQVLATKYPIAAELRKLRTVDQVIKNFLCQADDDVSESATTPMFSRGLASCVDEDHRIRTRIGQLTDSGRYTSSGPNLMNQHKKMESELRRIFTLDEERLLKTRGWANLAAEDLKAQKLLPDEYAAIRSCFMAPPGWVLIESDFKQAELNVLAFMSRDENMISIVSDPKRDLHSEMAVQAFRLTCKPEEVKKLYPDKRVMAKAVIFGIAYGRGASALVRQLKTEGVSLMMEDAQELIDTFYTMFPRVLDYVCRCKAAVRDPGYVETAWGRRRYFHVTDDNAINAGLEREAVNHPIQGTVAGCLDLALHNFRQYRRYVEPNLDFKVILPVHDAVLIYAKPEDARHIMDVVIPVCMSHNTHIPSIGLTLQTDTEVKIRWDDHLDEDQVNQLIGKQ